MIITEAQLQHYKEKGYLVVPQLLPRDAIEELSIMSNKLLDGELKPERDYNGYKPEEFYTFWEPDTKDRTDLPRRERVRLMSWMSFHTDYFWKVSTHPNIYSILSGLFGSGVQFFADTIFMKPAHHGIEAALHQDTAFWPKLDPKAVNFWMAIDRATVENGCLHVIPGSQGKDLPHHKDPLQGWVLRDSDADVRRQIPIELEAGGAIFFDSGLIHRSYPNRSDRSRRAFTSVYVSDQVKHLEPWNLGKHHNYHFKLMTPPDQRPVSLVS